MGTEVLEVNMPGELVMWLYLLESEISMEQSGAGIILEYLKEQNMELAVHNQELVVRKSVKKAGKIVDAAKWKGY